MTDLQSDAAEGRKEPLLAEEVPPRQVERTGDDTPAGSVWSYIWRMSGKHQIGAGLFAVIVAVLDLIPVELQRRIVDDALMEPSLEMLLTLGAIYLGVALLHQLLKFLLRLYQGWISESAILYTRRHLLGLYGKRIDEGRDETGNAVSILTGEVDKLGGFVGEGVVQAATNIALLLGAVTYMLVVEPKIALVGLGFMLPQILLTPFLQRKLNQLVAIRVNHMRELSGTVSDPDRAIDQDCHDILPRLYGNRMRFFFVKFGLKALLNLLNMLAPLTVLIYGGSLVIAGESSVGVIVAFIAGFQRVSAPLRELIAFYRAAAQAEVQHRLIAEWMEDEKRRDRDC